MNNWTEEEVSLLSKYFTSQMTELALFSKIKSINPLRTFEAIKHKIRRMKEEGLDKPLDIAKKNLRVGYLDIETTNLHANFGYILSWVIKPKDSNKYDFGVITKKEIANYTLDKNILLKLLETLKKYDVVYAHYGTDRKFDIPYIRTRAFVHGVENKLPQRMELFIMDTWIIAKNKLRLHSNRLDVIGNVLGVTTKKTPLDPSTWQLAAIGHEESLKYILKHNVNDVLLLEAIHKKLENIESKTYRSI
jgi:uncharacterized protein YprB with RNaseH-like and TPR domain